MKDYSYPKYPKIIAHSETGSPRQVKELIPKTGDVSYDLSEKEKKTVEAKSICFWHNLSIYA
ncbi:MAG: hypothetical protein LBV62_01945 [Rickettsiales bacterium]|jgi:hypothetical protein|nr:hypothetical protein [Rickettsiales bacterium]